jgi:hypothetical protein
LTFTKINAILKVDWALKGRLGNCHKTRIKRALKHKPLDQSTIWRKNMKETKNFKFEEKQGRLIIELTCYLEQDLTNEELEKVFNKVKVEVDHALICDYEINPIGE